MTDTVSENWFVTYTYPLEESNAAWVGASPLELKKLPLIRVLFDNTRVSLTYCILRIPEPGDVNCLKISVFFSPITVL